MRTFEILALGFVVWLCVDALYLEPMRIQSRLILEITEMVMRSDATEEEKEKALNKLVNALKSKEKKDAIQAEK